MRHLAKNAGLDLYQVRYDSYAFQFWGSEQYKKDIPLLSENSYAKGLDGSMFTASDISEFESRARELNEQEKGDQAVFYFRKMK